MNKIIIRSSELCKLMDAAYHVLYADIPLDWCIRIQAKRYVEDSLCSIYQFLLEEELALCGNSYPKLDDFLLEPEMLPAYTCFFNELNDLDLRVLSLKIMDLEGTVIIELVK